MTTGRVLRPGRSHAIEECTSAARLILERLDIKGPVDWVGNSWGGHLGLAAAARRLELVWSLVLLGTPVAAITWLERARTSLLLVVYRLSGPSAMARCCDSRMPAVLSRPAAAAGANALRAVDRRDE